MNGKRGTQDQRNRLYRELVGEGKFDIVPFSTNTNVTTLTVNMDLFCGLIGDHLFKMLQTYEPYRSRYSGDANAVTDFINADIAAIKDLICWCCYNRLRVVAERYAPAILTTRMKPKAPCSSLLEFPAFLSSLCESIGPLRIADGPVNQLIIYATTAETMQNYGRAEPHMPDIGCYERGIAAMRAAGIPLSPIPMTSTFGSFWTTTRPAITDNNLDILGTVHKSHYVKEDAIRAMILGSDPTRFPFEDISFTLGYVDNAATTTGLAAVAPANTPGGITADSETRPVVAHYNVNYYGLQLAKGKQQPRGFYVLGRGDQRVYTCYLARRITAYEQYELMRTRLLEGPFTEN